jgi:hypothetical protein
MLDRAEGTRVSIGWLMEQLGRRSFGLTLFVMAVIGFLPGASTFVGLLVAWPAIQMLLGHEVAVLPRLVARRQIAVDRLARVIRIVAPRLAWVERLVHPRWPIHFQTTKRLTGIATLLLGLSMMSPVPFSQVVPALVVMLLALAYLEEDGIALLIALLAALGSLARSRQRWCGERWRRSTGSTRRAPDSRTRSDARAQTIVSLPHSAESHFNVCWNMPRMPKFGSGRSSIMTRWPFPQQAQIGRLSSDDSLAATACRSTKILIVASYGLCRPERDRRGKSSPRCGERRAGVLDQ